MRAGDRVPDVELRTDEGTPLRFADLEGRALAVFFLGAADDPESLALLRALARRAAAFLAVDVSPLVVLAASIPTLEALRARLDPPFLLLACANPDVAPDPESPGGLSGAWVVSPGGIVIEALPKLAAEEMAALALTVAERAFDPLGSARSA